VKVHRPTDQNALIGFMVRFSLVSGFLYFLLHWIPDPWLAHPLKRHTAQMSAFLLGLAGLHPTVGDALISARGFTVRIVSECTAIFMVILYFAFVTAYPTSLKNKLVGLAFGLPFLTAANLLRIVAVFLAGVYYRELFDYLHVYIGQIAMVMLVLLTCMVWLRYTAAVRLSDRPLAFLIRFVGYSSIPFVVWLYLDQGFVLANLYLVRYLLGWFGMQITTPETIRLYPQTFNTFHLIAFTALILAMRSIEGTHKIRSLLIGLAILCTAHFLFRLHYSLFINLHIKAAGTPFIALIILNQWILPFVLWLFLVRNALFKRSDRFICPVCGEEKAGLVAHMRAKHGETVAEEWERWQTASHNS
jgi:exosortase H (IPTLxxWG-CTERM-specific)